MRRMQRTQAELPFLDELLSVGDGAPSLAAKIELAGTIRTSSPDLGPVLDAALLEHLERARQGLQAAEAMHAELRELLERLAAPPWHPALFLRAVETALGPRAMVLYGGNRRLVGMTDDVPLDSLATGEEVFLGPEGNVVQGVSPYGTPRHGETAFFERATGDGRFVLRWRDEEVVVGIADALRDVRIEAGDQVRWDRAACLALEKIEGAKGRRFIIDDVPDVGRDQVGGQDANLERVLSALTATLVDPARASRYRIGKRRTILMVGSPGCGKTLTARVAAAELRRLSGQRCAFAVVKPAEWESPWVGESQQNIRNCFRALREVEDGYAVLFLDEIDAIGRIRGGAANPHGDKSLTALLAELDGFSDREGVVIIAATNRKDLVDPALLERLSDIEVTFQRPDMRGARAIFEIHLPEDVPVQTDRDELIETAVSRFYSPNGGNEICTIGLRDGKVRTVAARELASGRMFSQVCRSACLAAFLREVRGGPAGVRVADVEEACAEAMERLAATLTPRNVHAYLADLPQDVDVVRVEPVVRKTARPHRYRHAA